jgi:hypothetical protein
MAGLQQVAAKSATLSAFARKRADKLFFLLPGSVDPSSKRVMREPRKMALSKGLHGYTDVGFRDIWSAPARGPARSPFFTIPTLERPEPIASTPRNDVLRRGWCAPWAWDLDDSRVCVPLGK